MKTLLPLTIRLPPSTRSRFFLPIAATRHVNTFASREDQAFFLPDGRVLGYAECGCRTGYPLIYFHGFPMSRLEASGLDDVARRHQLRVVAPDRPGFGLSTFQPHRRITDWPADVQALARHLRLSRFAIVGGSGGGPYALACAHALPREMLSAVGIMGGAPPWQAGTQAVLISSRMFSVFTKYWPAGARRLTEMLVRTLRIVLATRPATRWIDDWLNKAERTNDEKTPIEEQRKQLLRTLFEGFAQGTEGMVHEARLLTQDWGFRFEDVAYDRIQLWHGTHDKNAPVRMIRYMVERLPHAVLREFAGESHWTLVRHLDEIISEIVPKQSSEIVPKQSSELNKSTA